MEKTEPITDEQKKTKALLLYKKNNQLYVKLKIKGVVDFYDRQTTIITVCQVLARKLRALVKFNRTEEAKELLYKRSSIRILIRYFLREPLL